MPLEKSRGKSLLSELPPEERWALALHETGDVPGVIAVVAGCNERTILNLRNRRGNLPSFPITERLIRHYGQWFRDIIFPDVPEQSATVISLQTARKKRA